MKNTIVHPTDFSKCANDALDYAIELAKILNCKINIVHSLDFDGELHATHNASSMLAMSQKVEKTAEIKLKALGDKVIENNVECTAGIYTGKIHSWLPDYISENKPMLVIMGTTGAGSVANKIFGSNTYAIIKNSKSPILAIPEATELKNGFKNFVLSTAYRDRDVEAIMFLARLAKPSNAEISVVHVLSAEASKKKNNQHLLDDLARRVRVDENYFNIKYDLLYSNDPESRLRILVEEKNPDMLTLIMRKQGFFERLFFGSLTEKLAYNSNVPLLIFPAD
ncbi:MAG: hypothetical protein GQ574_29185 [Crocinitomix sp.]|nr:hypothetical protein [Crocinitomix sp.]